MDLLIVVKWLTNYDAIQGARPPSVITQMITMCLNFGEQPDPKLRETELLPNQPLIMKTLLIIALVCVPIMLFVKPIYENSKHDHVEVHEIIEEDRRQTYGGYVPINDSEG
jgi:V-type H+-transporting ATPase subunit a